MDKEAGRGAPQAFRPTPDDLHRIEGEVAAIADIQKELLAKAPDLKLKDRVAHQFQIAGGKVHLRIAPVLPENLRGVGLFEPGSEHIGVGRVSTGLGCPHAETAPDFLGLMLAFATRQGARVDFLAINDPASPTDTHSQFIRLLEATAKGAGSGLIAGNLRTIASLVASLGPIAGASTAAHVLRQTSRTVHSTTAHQTYWTGVVETGDVLGKFILAPVLDDAEHASPPSGPRQLSEEWRLRWAAGPIGFDLFWTPYIDEEETPLRELAKPWNEDRVLVGHATFPQPASGEEAELWAALAAEMGANPGHWVRDRDNTIVEPETEFGTARKFAYRSSQAGRGALPEAAYAGAFAAGVIDAALAEKLKRRREEKRRLGHVDGAG
jgi:hypothetical protein